MSQNNQNLPGGLANRAAAAAAGQPVHEPAPQAPAAPQYDQQYPTTHQYQQPQQPQQPAPQEPNAPYNPMLSRMTAPPEPGQAVRQEPQQPAAPAEPEPTPRQEPAPTEGQPVGDVKALADVWASDPNVAPALSYLENVSSGKDVDLNRAFSNAIETGDSRFIDRAYLKEVFGDDAESVAKAAESVLAYANAQSAESTKAVYTLAGGESNWNQAADYFSKNASEAEKAAMRHLMDSGKRENIEYAAQQVLNYATNAGAAVRHNSQALGLNSGARGLSKEEYQKAISSNRRMSPEQYESLKEQRRLGISQGL